MHFNVFTEWSCKVTIVLQIIATLQSIGIPIDIQFFLSWSILLDMLKLNFCGFCVQNDMDMY